MELVLATQDCDLVKPNDRLPYVEAIGCVQDPDLARKIKRNDQRFFVLDPDKGLVADRAYVVMLERAALVGQPSPASPCGGDPTRARRFATWLGSRYDRPALPEAAVKLIQKPLVAAIERLCRPGRPHAQLNADLHEIRLTGDLDGGAPFRIGLVFLISEKASIEMSELAIAELIEAAGFGVEGVTEPGEANVVVERWVVAPPSRLSVAVYHDSVPVSLAYYSVDGEEVTGAEPLDAESA